MTKGAETTVSESRLSCLEKQDTFASPVQL
jgi:hypothetical protein